MSDTDDFTKVILPMIRKILPSTIARELVSVQPMTDFIDKYRLKLETGVSYDPENEMPEWYWVKCHQVLFEQLDEMTAWCKSTFGKVGGDLWQLDISQRTFLFTHERDQMVFLLRWSE